MPSVWIHNFGCRANQADGATLAAGLRQAGWTHLSASAAADWIVLNTCTVTAAADAEARAAVRRLHRDHPRSRILVTGCYAQRAAAELARIEGVSCVVGNSHKHALPALLAAAGAELPRIVSGDISTLTPLPLPAGGERTRPNLKVQEGCDSRCTFCVIPAVRGPSRSLPLPRILERVRALAAAGYRELVLTGINLGRWGRDLEPGLRLHRLVRAILEETELPRLRLSSVEPMDWDEELIRLFAAEAAAEQPRLARHFHVPLQSGSDGVLRRMRRRYATRHYSHQLARLHAAAPAAAIGADVMVGFPGETEAEFEETCAFIAAHPLTYLHVFPFSAREGTAATAQLGRTGWSPVARDVAAERRRRLLAIMEQRRPALLAAWLGRRLSVITLARAESASAEGSWSLSDNFLQVRLDGTFPANVMLQVQIVGCGDKHLLAATEQTSAHARVNAPLPILAESYP